MAGGCQQHRVAALNIFTNLSIGGLTTVYQAILVTRGEDSSRLWVFLGMCGAVTTLFLKARLGGPGFVQKSWAQTVKSRKAGELQPLTGGASHDMDEEGGEQPPAPSMEAPGANLPAGSAYCHQCNFFRPPRAHHCSECKRYHVLCLSGVAHPSCELPRCGPF